MELTGLALRCLRAYPYSISSKSIELSIEVAKAFIRDMRLSRGEKSSHALRDCGTPDPCFSPISREARTADQAALGKRIILKMRDQLLFLVRGDCGAAQIGMVCTARVLVRFRIFLLSVVTRR